MIAVHDIRYHAAPQQRLRYEVSKLRIVVSLQRFDRTRPHMVSRPTWNNKWSVSVVF